MCPGQTAVREARWIDLMEGQGKRGKVGQGQARQGKARQGKNIERQGNMGSAECSDEEGLPSYFTALYLPVEPHKKQRFAANQKDPSIYSML